MKLSDEQAKKFAFNLSRMMYARGLSQAELARTTGLTSSAISNWLQRTNYPSAESVVAIARALHVNVRELIGRDRCGKSIRLDEKAYDGKVTTGVGHLKAELMELVERGYFRTLSLAAGKMIALGLEVWERENNREEKSVEPENNSEPNVKEIRTCELKDLPLKVVREEPRRKEPPRKLRLIDTLFDAGYALK